MKTISLTLLFLLLASSAFAYMENYPPFQKSEKKPTLFLTQEVPDEYTDGDLIVKTYKKYPDTVMPWVTEIYLKDKLIWSAEGIGDDIGKTDNPRTLGVRKADFDGNGLEDIIVITGNYGNTLCVYMNSLTLFLKAADNKYSILRIETMTGDALQDLIDFNGDGKPEILKCDLVQDVESSDGKTHSYWLYNIYELKENQLVLNNSLLEGFPKFIQYTHKPNDKPTKKVSKTVQQQYTSPKVPKVITVDSYRLALEEKAKERDKELAWNKIEQPLYAALGKQGDYSFEAMAENEETVGHALMVMDSQLAPDNQWERAAIHLRRAGNFDEKRFMAFYDLGLIFIDTEEGDEYFRKAIKANPDYAPSYYWLAYDQVRAGRDEEGMKIFEQYLKVAKGEEEEGRIKVAKAVLSELRSGKPGPEVAKMRRPVKET